jgi:hypothetical protein
MKGILFHIFVLTTLILLSCNRHYAEIINRNEETSTSVKIRILNSTSDNFDSCYFDPIGTSHGGGKFGFTFGTTNKSQYSNYEMSPILFQYFSIRIYANNKIYKIEPDDYCSQPPYSKGFYTLRIDSLKKLDRISFAVVKDKSTKSF